jgi:hypothetical protein
MPVHERPDDKGVTRNQKATKFGTVHSIEGLATAQLRCETYHNSILPLVSNADKCARVK